jgi:hypothetical protein
MSLASRPGTRVVAWAGEDMDVGAVSSGRAAVQAAQAHEAEFERQPILAARTGPAPLSSFSRLPEQGDLLRAALRERAVLLDLDPVLAKPPAEDAAQTGAPAALQATLLREPEEARNRRDSSADRAADAEASAPLREARARAHFSQAQAVLAESPEDLVVRFSDT